MASKCQQCGRDLAGDGPGRGLCPACVWEFLGQTRITDGVQQPVFPEIEGHTILSELSRGGMGVVYLARHHETAREVALKMLLPVMSSQTDVRDRFRVEIETLADLHHPGILPLFDAGEADGMPWFTMKLATGGSLAERLKEKRKRTVFPLPRWAATLVRNLAFALDYAHARGVLHRDVKPGNVLFDAGEMAYLADFGLAKLIDGEGGATRTAAILGTPWYMAPEVAQNGARVATVASDVYSLGAVLYELLAGRPPFMVNGMAALLRKIMEEEPERPSTIAAHVPRDLELICLTCLAKDPKHRYAGAAALASDLDLWLRGEPIAARRTSPLVRLGAWARRRPALASMSAALVLSLAGGSISLIVINRKLSNALAEARDAKWSLNKQGTFLTGDLTDMMIEIGRLDVLEKTFFDLDARMKQPLDYDSLKLRSRLNTRWASVTWMQGDGVTAVGRLATAITDAGSLAVERPGDGEIFSLIQEARCLQAEILADIGPIAQAEAVIFQVEQSLEQAVPPVDLDEQLRLRVVLDRTKALIITRFDAPKALEEGALQAVTSCRVWQEKVPQDPVRALALIRSLNTAGRTLMEMQPHRTDQARPLFEEGRRLALSLCEERPEPADARFELAQSTGWLGLVYRRLDQRAKALPALQEDRDIMARLVSGDGLNWFWRFKLADADYQLSEYWKAEGNQTKADEHRHWRSEALEVLIKQAPAVREWKLSLVREKAEAGEASLPENPARARELFDEAIIMGLELVKRQPESRTEQDGWRNLVYGIGEVWKKHGQPREALEVWTALLRSAETEAAASGEAAPWWRWTMSAAHRRLAGIHHDGGDFHRELEENKAALEIRASLLEARWLRATETPGEVANAFKNTIAGQLSLSLYGDALATASRAVQLHEKCQDVAGTPRRWAEPVRTAIEGTLKAGDEHAASARVLATRAAAVFYPPAMRKTLSADDEALVKSMESAGKSAPSPPLQ